MRQHSQTMNLQSTMLKNSCVGSKRLVIFKDTIIKYTPQGPLSPRSENEKEK